MHLIWLNNQVLWWYENCKKFRNTFETNKTQWQDESNEIKEFVKKPKCKRTELVQHTAFFQFEIVLWWIFAPKLLNSLHWREKIKQEHYNWKSECIKATHTHTTERKTQTNNIAPANHKRDILHRKQKFKCVRISWRKYFREDFTSSYINTHIRRQHNGSRLFRRRRWGAPEQPLSNIGHYDRPLSHTNTTTEPGQSRISGPSILWSPPANQYCQ